jgi:hypothetical protein
MHYRVVDLHLQILLQISGIQRIWVYLILSNILPLYLSFIKGRRYNILATRMHCISESRKGAKGILGTYYI